MIQSADSRDNMTQKAGIVRHENYTQFLQGIGGLRNLRLGVVRQGSFLFFIFNNRNFFSHRPQYVTRKD